MRKKQSDKLQQEIPWGNYEKEEIQPFKKNPKQTADTENKMLYDEGNVYSSLFFRCVAVCVLFCTDNQHRRKQ